MEMRCRAMDENSSSCVVAAELKYVGVPEYGRENRVCQEAFFIIMLPSTGLLQASLFPPITSIPLLILLLHITIALLKRMQALNCFSFPRCDGAEMGRICAI